MGEPLDKIKMRERNKKYKAMELEMQQMVKPKIKITKRTCRLCEKEHMMEANYWTCKDCRSKTVYKTGGDFFDE